MAALSVHIAMLGNTKRQPCCVHVAVISWRNSELAATPPPRAMVFAPMCFAAFTDFDTNTSTTAV